MMERVDKILNHDLFMKQIELIEESETNRIFCRHNLSHLLDVARIAMLLNLEENLGIEKEIIYTAALLHDIGRQAEYENGTPHEQAGVRIASEILADCGFEDKETSVIIKAIAMHRNKDTLNEDLLMEILNRADQLSRPCFACKARSTCHWEEDRKNKNILW